ncbi:hypothetical protein RFI_27796 [Reticulomyxa filosa]|uniref:Sec23/Sec24 trunk domain-containing protein n=1 Tax=Reticulomyxa filosa TaxID=46433 RepID=X6M7E4_RETFI|nr:hypothetical protein RFI_27796 [Reticulomyxa filosa]|eukprot:ETO09581.1 hypothetical protein RFI_27796 [Reticulomyxa filosa]
MRKQTKKMTVGLVTFSNEVTVVGDGVNDPEFIAGDKLNNMEQLKEIGSKHKLDKTIKESLKPLTEKLWSLVEKGQTALGPALVVSIALAAQKSGSQVILCTDGLANIGLGNLDVTREEDVETAEQWYAQVAHWALEKGVVVNVISITDSQCKLENLGKLCDITQGAVERINPIQLASNFKGILEKKVLATKVQATMLLHPVLRFKKDDEEENRLVLGEQQKAEKEKSTLTTISEEQSEKPTSEKSTPNEEKSSQIEITKQIQDVGNVFQDSRIYFEYVIPKSF